MTARSRYCRAVLVGSVIMFIVAAACSGPRSGASITGEISGCAAVLPLANHIVHDEGTLTLVRRISRSQADALSRKLGVTSPASPRSHLPRVHRAAQSRWPKTCLVVYHGDYPRGRIVGASPPAVAGHYTLLVLRIRHPSVDRILVTDRLPHELFS